MRRFNKKIRNIHVHSVFVVTSLLALHIIAPLPLGRGEAAETLKIVSWGGAYEAAQQRALFEPYQEKTGKSIEILTYKGSIAEIDKRAEKEGWDIVDMVEDQAIAACEKGLLQHLDHNKIVSHRPVRDIEDDFAPLRFTSCAIPQNVYAKVIAYDDSSFPGIKPSKIGDFFDIERFPGKRAVEKSPDGLLEWALLSEGVPQRQIYDLLSTDRGLWIAFRKLNRIRNEIIWWEDPAEPAALLESGEVAMASGYNGRFFSAVHERKAPVVILWDGQLIGYDVWAVPKGADTEAAYDFLRFATEAKRMADLAELIPYGPARSSALEQIGLHPDNAIPMREYLPNARLSSGRYLIRDAGWYANTQSLRTRRFQKWLEQKAE